MQDNQLQRAINLTKKTGDRLIVFDKAESESPYVVMSLDEYEKLVIGHSEVRGLTENELLDKINRDIAIWKSDSEYSGYDNMLSDFDNNINDDMGDIDDIYDFNETDQYDSEIEDMYKDDFSSPGLKEMQKSFSKKGNVSKNSWSIPPDRKEAAEEVVGEEDEDRQYLEELPF
jgi:hypothetical protein